MTKNRKLVFGDRECGTRSGYTALTLNDDGTIEIETGNPFEAWGYTLTVEEVTLLRKALNESAPRVPLHVDSRLSLIEQAAKLCNSTVGDFLVDSAFVAAKAVVEGKLPETGK